MLANIAQINTSIDKKDWANKAYDLFLQAEWLKKRKYCSSLEKASELDSFRDVFVEISSKTLADRTYYLTRIINGVFTSVVSYYQIDSMFVYRCLPYETPSLKPDDFSDPQRSWFFVPQYAEGRRSGRSELSRFEAMTWSPGNEIDAVREKIDGIGFVKIIKGDKAFLVGDYDIEVPVDFPVKHAERVGNVFFILSPYGQGEFRFCNHVFRFHEWTHTVQQSEGVIILSRGVEYRCKYAPSTEVLVHQGMASNIPLDVCDGVWEVVLNGPSVFPLRPRFGCVHNPNALRYLRQTPSAFECDLKFNHIVAYDDVREGYVDGTFYVRRELVVSEATRRGWGESLVVAYTTDRLSDPLETYFDAKDQMVVFSRKSENGFVEIRTNKGVLFLNDASHSPDLMRSVISKWRAQRISDTSWGNLVEAQIPALFTLIESSKLLVARGLTSGLIKDGVKDYDFVGGKIEPGETPIVALKREFMEELGYSLDFPIEHVGTTDGFEGSFIFRTHMFVTILTETDIVKGLDFFPFCSNLKSVPWQSRLERFCMPYVMNRLLAMPSANVVCDSLIAEVSLRGLSHAAVTLGLAATDFKFVDLIDNYCEVKVMDRPPDPGSIPWPMRGISPTLNVRIDRPGKAKHSLLRRLLSTMNSRNEIT